MAEGTAINAPTKRDEKEMESFMIVSVASVVFCFCKFQFRFYESKKISIRHHAVLIERMEPKDWILGGSCLDRGTSLFAIRTKIARRRFILIKKKQGTP